MQGWIPTPVVNFALEAIPLNIARVRTALSHTPPATLERSAQQRLCAHRGWGGAAADVGLGQEVAKDTAVARISHQSVVLAMRA